MGIRYYLVGHSSAVILPQPGKGLWEWFRRQEQYCSCHGEWNYFRTGCCCQFVQVQLLTPRQAEMLSMQRSLCSPWGKRGAWRWNVWSWVQRALRDRELLIMSFVSVVPGAGAESCLGGAWRITKPPSTMCTTDISSWQHWEMQIAFSCLSESGDCSALPWSVAKEGQWPACGQVLKPLQSKHAICTSRNVSYRASLVFLAVSMPVFPVCFRR